MHRALFRDTRHNEWHVLHAGNVPAEPVRYGHVHSGIPDALGIQRAACNPPCSTTPKPGAPCADCRDSIGIIAVVHTASAVVVWSPVRSGNTEMHGRWVGGIR